MVKETATIVQLDEQAAVVKGKAEAALIQQAEHAAVVKEKPGLVQLDERALAAVVNRAEKAKDSSQTSFTAK